MNSLEQVVAEQGIFGDAVLQAALEGVDLVGSFADVTAFSKEVLVDIRYSPGIKVKTSIPEKIRVKDETPLLSGLISVRGWRIVYPETTSSPHLPPLTSLRQARFNG